MNEDTLIIKRVLAGETQAFRLLLLRYQKPLFRMVTHLLSDEHLAEDIAQDVFLSAFKKLSSFDPDRSAFSTWLFTIARNKTINALKKKKPLLAAQVPEKICHRPPDLSLIKKETTQKLDQALAQLPPRLKLPLVLAELEGRTYAEIAQIEGVSLGTVKSRIHRAKKKLKSILDKFEEQNL